MTAIYTEMEIAPVDHGDTVKIAVCKNFAGVVQAQQDGYHAALMRNWKTVMYGMFLNICVNNGVIDRLVNSRSHRALTLGVRLRSKIFDAIQKRIKTEFGGVPTKVSDVVPGMMSGSGIHCDIMHGKDDMVLLLTSAPATVLYTKMPVERGFGEAFQVGPDEFADCAQIEQKNDPRAPYIQPRSGTAIFLFDAGEGYTIAHATPSMKYHDYTNRARIAHDIIRHPAPAGA